MKYIYGPGQSRPGLFLLLILLITMAGGCGIRYTQPGNMAPASSPSPHISESEKSNNGDKPAESSEPAPVVEVVEKNTADDEPETKQKENKPDESNAEASGEQLSMTPEEMRSEFKQGSSSGKLIALTFDAGASPKPTPLILETLRRSGIRSTFFLTGKWMESYPDLVREIVNDGHEIGNHSYSHPDFRKLSDDAIKEQLSKTEEIAQQTAHVSTKPLFRPPFGGRDSRVLDVLAGDGYRSIYWSVDSWDAFKKDIKAEEIRQRVLDRSTGGSIVLMHCGSQATAEALPSIIETLQSRGYHLVTVSEMVTSSRP